MPISTFPYQKNEKCGLIILVWKYDFELRRGFRKIQKEPTDIPIYVILKPKSWNIKSGISGYSGLNCEA